MTPLGDGDEVDKSGYPVVMNGWKETLICSFSNGTLSLLGKNLQVCFVFVLFSLLTFLFDSFSPKKNNE